MKAIGPMEAIGLTAFGGPDVLRVLDLLELPMGTTVAVTGAAGAVDGYAVQPAKADGFRVIADAAPKDQHLVKELGADVVLLRGTDFPELVRKEIPAGVDGLVDTAGITALAIRAVRDGGRMASSVGGVQVPGERGIQTRNAFVPQYAREHGKLDRLRELTEKGGLTPRVARPCRPSKPPKRTDCWRQAASGDECC
ncbi:zinc-binding dehydrogenase [Streptomyces sp. NPDC048504]|uniref:zinc-binding dehydrogenase n=1 Tax=Streptomyces sp. NPDC048504 TaxID=3365559 RepID=UPI003724AD42